MPERQKNARIRHIAVALDCSPHSRASLGAAAELARLLNAELTGIFVEDIKQFLFTFFTFFIMYIFV